MGKGLGTRCLLLYDATGGGQFRYMRMTRYASSTDIFNLPEGSMRARKAGVSQFL